MKTVWQSIILAALIAVILAAGIQPASAAKEDILYGTTGVCNNVFPRGACTETSTLVQLDPRTGALIDVIGEVGYTVNGLAWDSKSQKLYASTSIGCGEGLLCSFHGLITIDPETGAGTPVNEDAPNFGLDGDESPIHKSPIHSITIDSRGRMVAWYDENGPYDTFVQIDRETGVATETLSEINTSQNGLSFNQGNNQLWNIDVPRGPDPNSLTQIAYQLDPATGATLGTVSLTPPTSAALGDFNPADGLYYGLNFEARDPEVPTSIVVVDVRDGTVTELGNGQTVANLHTLAFAKVKVK
jgi:hypothetical protein